MTAAVFWAWLHYLAVLMLFAALVAEHLLFRPVIDTVTARRLAVLDMLYGISALAVLITGILRMSHEKGVAYYMQHGAFHALVGLFVLIGLLSIYPTLVFLRWRPQLRAGQAPVMAATTVTRITMILRIELALLPIAVLMAVWMTRGP